MEDVLYRVMFLYMCFLDGWNINILEDEIKLQIKKIKLQNSPFLKNKENFNLNAFITYNNLFN